MFVNIRINGARLTETYAFILFANMKENTLYIGLSDAHTERSGIFVILVGRKAMEKREKKAFDTGGYLIRYGVFFGSVCKECACSYK